LAESPLPQNKNAVPSGNGIVLVYADQALRRRPTNQTISATISTTAPISHGISLGSFASSGGGALRQRGAHPAAGQRQRAGDEAGADQQATTLGHRGQLPRAPSVVTTMSGHSDSLAALPSRTAAAPSM